MVTMTTQYTRIGRTHYNGHPDSINHTNYIAKAAIQITGIVQTRRVTMTLLLTTATQTILASMATITTQASRSQHSHKLY